MGVQQESEPAPPASLPIYLASSLARCIASCSPIYVAIRLSVCLSVCPHLVIHESMFDMSYVYSTGELRVVTVRLLPAFGT